MTSASEPLEYLIGGHATEPTKAAIQPLSARVREVMGRYRQELTTYVREAPRLLQDGNQGRYALLQGDRVHGVWDKQNDALQFGRDCFSLDQQFLAQQLDNRYVEIFRQFLLESSCPKSEVG
jgi:hypothetical protein